MQKSAEGAEEEISEVNIVPLADVTLVLLIMIMLLSPMVLQSMIQVQAAQAVASPTKDLVREKPLFVDVKKDGYTINNQLFSSEYELYRALQKQMSARKDKTVLISSQPDVAYQNVVRVLDLVRQSGAVSLSLVPRKKDGGA